MDRRNYDTKAIALFDTIGSYFVDVYYNSHFLLARDAVREGRAVSITDAYRANVLNYMIGISKRDDLYKTVVRGLHEFYQKNSGFGSVVLSEFQDRILSQFIPPEYYYDFTEKHKDRILRELIIQTANDFGEVVTSKTQLARIVDDHQNKRNVTMLQDRIVDIFIIQRENYYSKFVKAISNTNGNTKISKDVVDKLKGAYVAEKKKNCDLEADKQRALNIIAQLMDRIDDYETKIAEFVKIENKKEDNAHIQTPQSDAHLRHKINNMQIVDKTDKQATKHTNQKNVKPKNTQNPKLQFPSIPQTPKKGPKIVQVDSQSGESEESRTTTTETDSGDTDNSDESSDGGETYRIQQEAIKNRNSLNNVKKVDSTVGAVEKPDVIDDDPWNNY